MCGITEEKGLRLAFNHGSTLPDPHKHLMGNAGIMRYMRLEKAEDLSCSELQELMIFATEKLIIPIPSSGKGRLIIKASKRKKAGGKKHDVE
jgi:hypothetical protein